MGLRQSGKGDRRHFCNPHRPRGLKPAMACNDAAFGVSQDWIGEAERFDRRFDLIDLTLRVGPGIARIRNEITHCTVGDVQPWQGLGRNWCVHIEDHAWSTGTHCPETLSTTHHRGPSELEQGTS